jgi:hypothetical protein
MKKLIFTIAIIITLFVSCDKYYYNQLYIINNCDELIAVSITNTWNIVDTFSVQANTTFMFNEGEGITSPKGIIEKSFTKFEVTKNGVISKINYRNFERWIYQEEDKYHSKLFLPINPEDFE